MLRQIAGKFFAFPIGLRRSLLLVLFGVALVVSLAQQPAGTVRQIAPGVYFRQGDRDGRQPANTSWVVFRDYVVLIDANPRWRPTAG